MTESSAESALYALSTGHKVGRNFRLMVHETLADDILLNLRCDNEATIAMLDNPSWRTRYLSIYGETIRQEVKLENAILTYPKTLLRLFFCLARLFEFSGVIFRDPPRISFKTSIKIASRGYLYFLRLFFASRGLF